MIDVLVAVILVFVAGVSVEGLFISISMFLLNFPVNHAVLTSKALIFVGLLADKIFNILKK
jgi:hypothetical protein